MKGRRKGKRRGRIFLLYHLFTPLLLSWTSPYHTAIPPVWHVYKCLLIDKGFCEIRMSLHLQYILLYMLLKFLEICSLLSSNSHPYSHFLNSQMYIDITFRNLINYCDYWCLIYFNHYTHLYLILPLIIISSSNWVFIIIYKIIIEYYYYPLPYTYI